MQTGFSLVNNNPNELCSYLSKFIPTMYNTHCLGMYLMSMCNVLPPVQFKGVL